MISLDMIDLIEDSYGSLYQIAENLINNVLPQKNIKGILNIIGCNDDNLSDEELLINILLDILEPIDSLGAISLGEI